MLCILFASVKVIIKLKYCKLLDDLIYRKDAGEGSGLRGLGRVVALQPSVPLLVHQLQETDLHAPSTPLTHSTMLGGACPAAQCEARWGVEPIEYLSQKLTAVVRRPAL